MAFTHKNWEDSPSVKTPINAAGLIDLETRVAAYAEEAPLNSSQLPSSAVTDSRGSAVGDLLVYSGSTFARLAAGTKGQQLTVRSDGTIKWTDTARVSASAWGVDFTGTTDTTAKEQEAINYAVETGQRLVYEAGTIKRTGTPPKIPVDLTRTLYIECNGTVFNLESGALKAFDHATAAAGKTVGNVDISGFTVDGKNQRAPKEGTSEEIAEYVVIGCGNNWSNGTQVNVENVFIHNFTVVNVPAPLPESEGGKGLGRRAISYTTWHPESGLSENKMVNIRIEDWIITGGSCAVIILSQSPQGGGAAPRASANIFHDSNFVRRGKWINPAPTFQGKGAAVQMGGESGWGRVIGVEDIESYGSVDVCVEIDSVTRPRIKRCVSYNCKTAAFLANQYACCGNSSPVASSLSAEAVAATGPVTLHLTQATGLSFKVGDSVVFAETEKEGEKAEIVTVESVISATEITVSTTAFSHAARTFIEKIGKLSEQLFEYEDCHAIRNSGESSSWKAFQVQNIGNPLPIGHIRYRDCSHYRNTEEFGDSQGEVLASEPAATGAAMSIKGNITAKAEKSRYAGKELIKPKMVLLKGGLSSKIPTTVVELELGLSYEGEWTGTAQSFTATTTNGNKELTAVSSFTNLFVGQLIAGSGIPGGATITELKPGENKLVMSANASAGAEGVSLTATGGLQVELFATRALKAILDCKMTLSLNMPASGKKRQVCCDLSSEDTTSEIQGQVQVFIRSSTSDETGTLNGIRLPEHKEVIKNAPLRILPGDFTGIPNAGQPIGQLASSGSVVSILPGSQWTKPPLPVELTVPATEAEMILETGYSGTLVLSGGGGVTSASLSRDAGKTFSNIVAQTSGELKAPVPIQVSNRDRIKVTYTGAKPTAKFIPQS